MASSLLAIFQDIVSYNTEQARGEMHNIVAVLMTHKGLDRQSALDFAGTLCNQTLDRFTDDWANIPSWGPKVDKEVKVYVSGLLDWMAGALEWNFETERYFGKKGRAVKANRLVTLLPPSRHK